ncbi:MAG: hypothetical protein ACKODK_15145 [Opitutaceae bacterium]
MRLVLATCALFGVVLLGACASADKPGERAGITARFHLESADGEGLPAVLPRSGVVLSLNPKPVLTEADIAGADVAEVELGRCLLLTLTPAAGRDLYRLSVAHQGRRMALQLDGAFIGARRIDGPISDGRVFIFIELPDEALPGVVAELRKTAAAIRKKTGDKR